MNEVIYTYILYIYIFNYDYIALKFENLMPIQNKTFNACF